MSFNYPKEIQEMITKTASHEMIGNLSKISAGEHDRWHRFGQSPRRRCSSDMAGMMMGMNLAKEMLKNMNPQQGGGQAGGGQPGGAQPSAPQSSGAQTSGVQPAGSQPSAAQSGGAPTGRRAPTFARTAARKTKAPTSARIVDTS